MQVSPRPELDQRYQQLKPLQKAIVDARVENPDATNRKIAWEFAPKLYNERHKDESDEPKEEANESYTSQFLNDPDIEELVQYKQDIQDNQRETGSMQTTGDPFSADPNMPEQKSGWQSVKERPVKQTQDPEPTETYQFQAPVQVEIQDDRYRVDFEKEYFMHLLSSKRLPPELHQELVEAVLEEKSV
jgi:hypothetical protein